MTMIDPLYSLSGFAVGMLVGMTGVGGGSLMTPLLILLFGIHPATLVTLAILSKFNLSGEAASSLITLVLSIALFATAFVLVFGGPIVAIYRARIAELDPSRTAMITVVVGVVLGVLVSISSVGAGAIGVIALIMLYPSLPMAKIVGSDIAQAVPLTLVAGLGHWMM